MRRRFKIFCLILLALLFIGFLYYQKKANIIRVKTSDIKNELISLGKKHNLEFSEVQVTSKNDITARYKSLRIIFSTTKNLSQEVVSLQKILKSTTIESGAEEVDFRFNKVVIR